MKKIGIVTLYYNNYNFGGQLQAYAMQRIFTTPETESKLIAFKSNRRKALLQRLFYISVKNACNILMKKMLYKIIMLHPRFRREFGIRRSRFDSFMNDIPHTVLYNDITITECNRLFDQFVCGSDQVWNPGWWNDVLLLSFTNKVKYSYAASTGVLELKNKEMEHLKKKTADYIGISVREYQTKVLLQSRFKRDVDFVLDPTLLLDYEEWNELTNSPDITERYVLIYSMGDCTKYKKNIYAMSKQMGFKVVFIPGLTGNKISRRDLLYADKIVINAGPKEWLGWIKHAEYVFTDSFHGIVFSTVFEKKFWCYERQLLKDKTNENSRLYSYLEMIGLRHRLLKSITDIDFLQTIDYEEVKEKISPYKKASFEYIHYCMNHV